MAVLLLVYIAFALLASIIAIPSIRTVITFTIAVIIIAMIKAVVLMVFAVYIKGFGRLLRFIGWVLFLL